MAMLCFSSFARSLVGADDRLDVTCGGSLRIGLPRSGGGLRCSTASPSACHCADNEYRYTSGFLTRYCNLIAETLAIKSRQSVHCGWNPRTRILSAFAGPRSIRASLVHKASPQAIETMARKLHPSASGSIGVYIDAYAFINSIW